VETVRNKSALSQFRGHRTCKLEAEEEAMTKVRGVQIPLTAYFGAIRC